MAACGELAQLAQVIVASSSDGPGGSPGAAASAIASAYVIDVNPRIYGAIGLAIAAGQNLPAIWTDLLLGRTPLVRPD